MTEYTSDPAAVAAYLAARERTTNWIQTISADAHPSVPPSLVADSDDNLSSPELDEDSDASLRSLPPRMILKYPDGRDMAIGPSKEERERYEQGRRHRERQRRGTGTGAGTGKNPYGHMQHQPQSAALYVPPPLHAHPHPAHPSPIGIPRELSPPSSNGTPIPIPGPMVPIPAPPPPPGPSTSGFSIYSWSHGPPVPYPPSAYPPPAPSSRSRYPALPSTLSHPHTSIYAPRPPPGSAPAAGSTVRVAASHSHTRSRSHPSSVASRIISPAPVYAFSRENPSSLIDNNPSSADDALPVRPPDEPEPPAPPSNSALNLNANPEPSTSTSRRSSRRNRHASANLTDSPRRAPPAIIYAAANADGSYEAFAPPRIVPRSAYANAGPNASTPVLPPGPNQLEVEHGVPSGHVPSHHSGPAPSHHSGHAPSQHSIQPLPSQHSGPQPSHHSGPPPSHHSSHHSSRPSTGDRKSAKAAGSRSRSRDMGWEKIRSSQVPPKESFPPSSAPPQQQGQQPGRFGLGMLRRNTRATQDSRGGGGGDVDGDDSDSSKSTYYILPSPGQKVRIIRPPEDLSMYQVPPAPDATHRAHTLPRRFVGSAPAPASAPAIAVEPPTHARARSMTPAATYAPAPPPPPPVLAPVAQPASRPPQQGSTFLSLRDRFYRPSPTIPAAPGPMSGPDGPAQERRPLLKRIWKR